MLLYIITGSVMLVCLIALMVCGKKQHNSSAAKPLALVFLVLIIVCGIVMLIHYNKSKDPKKYITQNLKFQRSSGYVLAKHMSKGLPGAQVIILLDKSKNSEPVQKAWIEGMEEGFSENTKDILYITPSVKATKTKDGTKAKIMDVVKAKDLNFTLKKYPKCKILISLIGFPKDIKDLSLVEKFKEDPKNAMKIGVLHYGLYNYAPFIEAGFISAAVVADPTKKYSLEEPSSDIQETFDRRFLLITPDNVDTIAQKYPRKIFKKSK